MLYGHQEVFVFMLLLPVICLILVPLAMLVIWFIKTIYVKLCSSLKVQKDDTEFDIKNLKTTH